MKTRLTLCLKQATIPIISASPSRINITCMTVCDIIK